MAMGEATAVAGGAATSAAGEQAAAMPGGAAAVGVITTTYGALKRKRFSWMSRQDYIRHYERNRGYTHSEAVDKWDLDMMNPLIGQRLTRRNSLCHNNRSRSRSPEETQEREFDTLALEQIEH